MKKLAVIGLLGVLLFNWIGYRFYTSFLQDRAKETLISNLDSNDYSEDQLITIKVPVTLLSYYNNNSFFERIDGEIEYHGLQYRYVKHRIYNDTLELQCIYDQRRTELLTARDRYFNLVSDFQSPGAPEKTKKNAAAGTPFNGDFLSKQIVWSPAGDSVIATTFLFSYADRLSFLARLPRHLPPRTTRHFCV